ncbi:flagellar basal body rod protein FlgB [Bacillus amyloliquefaciens]|uniref:flagellar basal body rod protein FlgB n=1 Tax=Bacillus amyloliquefaciens TaxID=1390 RepID=UPI002807781F|nr:flagellar basal body rod protein FlgB [Bacillus amyloliquefaciens]MDQ8091241.1 flagellar basal body rod protein FlgB [Bacillus amyloliquefaciens]
MDLFSGTIQNLENALGRADIKQKVLTNNFANIDTPNYKAKKVSFRNLLDQETSNLEAVKTDYRHVDFTDSGDDYSIVSSGDTSYQQNGNNVDIDKEMTDLAENQINYQALVERMSGKFNSLKTVLTGGK